MKIIITNDDGFGAPGLEALQRAADGLGEVIVAAPDRQYSGCGHQVTTHAPIAVQEMGRGYYRIGGTPADCTRIGLQTIAPDAALVLSGINAGGNLGVDVYISGTVAAAREAVLLGIPAIAVSLYRKKERNPDWVKAARWTRRVIEEILARRRMPPAKGSGTSGPDAAHPPFWNVNLPCLGEAEQDPALVFCALDISPLPVSYILAPEEAVPAAELPGSPGLGEAVLGPAAGVARMYGEACTGSGEASLSRSYHYSGVYDRRPRVAGRDVDVCLGGRIAVTEFLL